jgi:hypothetical protein
MGVRIYYHQIAAPINYAHIMVLFNFQQPKDDPESAKLSPHPVSKAYLTRCRTFLEREAGR